MSVNRFKDHVWVVPEDDANRQLANGFLLYPAVNGTCIDIRPASGGWPRVLDEFARVHITQLRSYPLRRLVLLIDFDDLVATRTVHFKNQFPDDVAGRVYLLGARSEPEPLRAAAGCSLEKIGTDLAKVCADNDMGLWSHELLMHNQVELARLTVDVRHFLFRESPH